MSDKKPTVVYAATYGSVSAAETDLGAIEALHKDKLIGSFDAAVIDQEDGKPHVVKRMDRPGVRVIPEWFGGGTLPRKELHELAEQLTASQAGLIAVGEPTIEKALDKALTNADKVVKRTVDATTDEIGIAGFVLYTIFGVIILHTERPLAALGRAAQSLWNWMTRGWNRITHGHRPSVTGLDKRLLTQRDTISAVLDRKWRQAVLLTAGRLGFDFGCLLAALRATGADPRPSLVLLAYSAANIVALLPVTPGGLGLVEASLSGLLILAGVRPGYAFLATLAYRVASYWLPLLAGPPAYLLYRHRYGRPAARRATPGGAGSST